ncbi:MAG: Sapep family Mn(2+)-dependent dipeptidase [Emergencia sp.]
MKTFLSEYLDINKEQMIKDLGDFVAIPSVSEDLPNVRKALDYILELGERMGFKSINCLDGQVGVIEMGDGDETMGILTHVDVVDPGDMDVWETDPYELTLKDNKLFGRGTIDDKGMVIASLYAMKAVMALGIPLKKKVQLIMGTQEEVDWTDMDRYVKEYPLPDYGFTPDGEYPLCNIEKGSLDLDFEFDLTDPGITDKAATDTDITDKAACEDSSGKLSLKELNVGTAANVVPGKATAVLSDGSVVAAAGKSVHSCQPELGNNAIFELDKKLNAMGLAGNRLLDILHMLTDRFEDVYGEKLGLKSESEYYMGEFVHVNCFAPTIAKVMDGKLKVHINVRYPYGACADDISGTIEEIFREYGGNLVKCDDLPAVFVSKDAPFLSKLAEAYESVTSLKNRLTLAYGGSYAKAMPNIVSWGPLFEGEEDTCHCENEYISVDSFMANAKIFAESIASIALSDESFK